MRVFISLILIFCVSNAFACDKNAVEIQEIKIGCPLKDIDKYHQQLLFGEQGVEFIKGYMDNSDPSVSYNNRTKVVTIDDNVEHIEIYINDLDAVITNLDNKLGDHILGNYCELIGRNFEPNDEYCDQIKQNIYVWLPSEHTGISQARLAYFIDGFRLIISSNKYRDIFSKYL